MKKRISSLNFEVDIRQIWGCKYDLCDVVVVRVFS